MPGTTVVDGSFFQNQTPIDATSSAQPTFAQTNEFSNFSITSAPLVWHPAPGKNLPFVIGERIVGPAMNGIGNALSSCGNYLWKDLTWVVSSADSILTRMFNFIPGAHASSIGSSSPDHCEPPTGTYLESCHKPTIAYLSGEDKCRLETHCQTILAAIPPRFNELKFNPEDSLVLGNQNGTLTIQDESIIGCISPKEANDMLEDNLRALKEIDRKLDSSGIEEAQRKQLKADREDLLKKQSDIIGRLNAGEMITLDTDHLPIVITPENKAEHGHRYCPEALNSFQSLAKSTGGVMGLSRSPEHLSLIIEKLFQHILHTTLPDQPLDIAFVLDTTYSMSDDIDEVKRNLLVVLGHLKSEKAHVRVALLEYRDGPCEFLNRVNIDFTADHDAVIRIVQNIRADDTPNGDTPEAVYDALLSAKDKLSWNDSSRHVAILIGDAPPHSKTIDNQHAESEVLKQVQAKDIEIAIYPIVTNRISWGSDL